MNIEGFSEETIRKFVQNGFLVHYPDIFFLARHQEEILKLEGFGEKSYSNLNHAIENAKTAPMENFIYALGIQHVGLSGAKLLCRHFAYDFTRIRNAPLEELVTIEGFGEITSQSLVSYFADKKDSALLNEALSVITLIAPANPVGPSALLAGKTFVITGDVVHFKNRKELAEKIESQGGKVTGSVSAKTDYLINNDTASPSAKNKKAQALGVAIISEADFMGMLGTP